MSARNQSAHLPRACVPVLYVATTLLAIWLLPSVNCLYQEQIGTPQLNNCTNIVQLTGSDGSISQAIIGCDCILVYVRRTLAISPSAGSKTATTAVQTVPTLHLDRNGTLMGVRPRDNSVACAAAATNYSTRSSSTSAYLQKYGRFLSSAEGGRPTIIAEEGIASSASNPLLVSPQGNLLRV